MALLGPSALLGVLVEVEVGIGVVYFGKRKTKCSRFALPSRGVWIL